MEREICLHLLCSDTMGILYTIDAFQFEWRSTMSRSGLSRRTAMGFVVFLSLAGLWGGRVGLW